MEGMRVSRDFRKSDSARLPAEWRAPAVTVLAVFLTPSWSSRKSNKLYFSTVLQTEARHW